MIDLLPFDLKAGPATRVQALGVGRRQASVRHGAFLRRPTLAVWSLIAGREADKILQQGFDLFGFAFEMFRFHDRLLATSLHRNASFRQLVPRGFWVEIETAA
jgi:hypothetical protein